MNESAAIDSTERMISEYQQAEDVLAQLPADHVKLTHWQLWADQVFADQPWHRQLSQAMTIAYARMAVRNGSLSHHPRSYHNEYHINDLLLRIMYCQESSEQPITPERLALLSLFAACHDLRQAEPRKPESDDSLVGANEVASFTEAHRLMTQTSDQGLWTSHNQLLLKTMIEGSTFGSGGKRSKNFFQGNLAHHLLAQLDLPDEDAQLVLLACDIDTANVSLPIDDFADSAIDIYDELLSHQQANLSAHEFFSTQQKIYFFELQAFHADRSRLLFQPHKDSNQNSLRALSAHIEALPAALSDSEIKTQFKQKAIELSQL
ncbi:hypothetical protein ACFODZ_10900 [Marinicella sediminis]|uniref:HD domain-containing protein n=1 Tax=Marinicella sediminis TaxID=1792834 RepID=A0ABV7J9D6_9GAMM|nr:hypothetical protein [Marinicella sediminis]